jgi:hypothetical protein
MRTGLSPASGSSEPNSLQQLAVIFTVDGYSSSNTARGASRQREFTQMHMNIRSDKPARRRLWGRRLSKGLTCPRCHTRYEGIGCLECGWVTDTSVACGGSEALREGKAIA